ncbi:MAG: aminotransferase class I/II-fold pyridoxal phosphate-dependent enzyme [Microgenomates group bacterium]
MTQVSKRANDFPENPIRGMEPLVRQAKSEGINVIPLNIGAPDTSSPQEAKQAMIDFLNNTPAIPYGPSVGNYDLIKQLAKFYTEKALFPGVSEECIAVTQGASEALDLILYTIANNGETIATFDPAYPNYLAMCYRHDIQIIPIETTIAKSFHFDFETLDKQIPADTKAILWSSPCNPTGAVYGKQELEAILKIGRERDIWLIADEVYRSLDFEQEGAGFERSLSILDLANSEDRKRIIVLDSMSKLLGLCGARIGTVIADPKMISLLVSQASVRGSASTISQAGIEVINDIPDDYYAGYRQEFLERRDILYSELSKLSHLGVTLPPNPPEGAFYLIADLGVNAYSFAKWLITDYPGISKSKETVFVTPMVTPNGGFYLTKGRGQGEIRMAYVIEKELLTRAVAILSDALGRYKKIFGDGTGDSS